MIREYIKIIEFNLWFNEFLFYYIPPNVGQYIENNV